MRSKPGLIEKLIGTPGGNNSRGLIISQIQYTTPKIVANIVSAGLTSTGSGFDLNLDILEAVINVAQRGKFYRWAQHLEELIKYTCAKCREEGTLIKFPSLIIWIAMYHLRPVRDLEFNEPNIIDMWNFKYFSTTSC